MPFLRILFPGKDAPSTIVLRGSRITVGRRPDNTIQIIDRILSGVHAELLLETDGHYRLHDLDSTNGTSVNGQVVADYQLTEPCKISFGTFACEFDPGVPPEGDGAEAEVLPTRAEIESLKSQNAELKAKIDVLREEIASLTTVSKIGGETDPAGQQQAELQKLIQERAELRETENKRAEEIARLQSDLALARREGENLRGALKAGEAEIARLNALLDTAAPAVAPEKASAADTDETVSLSAEELAQAAAPAPAPPTPVRPVPAQPFPRVAIPPPSAPSLAPAPAAPKPAPGVPLAPRVIPPPPGRPMPRPTVKQGPTSPAAPTVKQVPTSPGVPRAVPKVAGPTGTQRIAPPTSPGSAGAPVAKPTVRAIPRVVATPPPKAAGEE